MSNDILNPEIITLVSNRSPELINPEEFQVMTIQQWLVQFRGSIWVGGAPEEGVVLTPVNWMHYTPKPNIIKLRLIIRKAKQNAKIYNG